MSKNKATLKQWSMSEYRGKVVASGIIYNDEANRFPDGTHVVTSRVLSVDIPNRTIETLNTVYNLVSPE